MFLITVPHQRPAEVSDDLTEDDVIAMAWDDGGRCVAYPFDYESGINLAELQNQYGEDLEELDPVVAAGARAGKSYTRYGDGGENGILVEDSEAPSEFEAALEFLGHDLHRLERWESIEDALTYHRGHDSSHCHQHDRILALLEARTSEDEDEVEA